MKLVSGAAAIALSLLSFIFSSLTVVFLVTMLTFAIMLVGLSRIVVGYGEKSLSGWVRLLNIVGGGIVFFFGFFTAIFSDIGFEILRIVLAGVFIALGIIRIASASKGELA